MPSPVTRVEAGRLLGVEPGADRKAVKQAYRRLAWEHHPDRGGDPGTFHQLRLAYERLVREPPDPVVARGRPSRPDARSASGRPREQAVDGIAWDRAPLALGERLDRDRLAAHLARVPPADALRGLVATSRAPGSRLNGVAPRLATELTASLRVGPMRDDRGRTILAVELVASSRRARRALDTLTPEVGWIRTRRPSSTRLRLTMPPAPDPRHNAVAIADRIERLLVDVTWPLDEWTFTGGAA